MLTQIGNYIGLTKYFDIEKSLIQKCYDLDKAKPIIEIDDILTGIHKTEHKLGYKFTQEQIDAVEAVKYHNVVVITGSGGTGKSGVVAAIAEVCRKYSIMLCALSAKAAQRMAELSKESACTIHKAVGFSGSKTTYNTKNTLPYYLIEMDEVSMNDLSIMQYALNAIQLGSKLILVGDHHQLPPIGPGAFFKDLIDDPEITTCYLTEILRQEKHSSIIQHSNLIKDKLSPVEIVLNKWISAGDMHYFFSKSEQHLRDIAFKAYYKSIKNFGIDDVMMILPAKKDLQSSTRAMNMVVSETLNSTMKSKVGNDNTFRVMDKVIQRKNDYKGKNVVNGEMGQVVDVSNITLTAKFPGHDENIVYYNSDLDELELAYSITVHAGQGSQWSQVIVLLDMTHGKWLNNQLLYTAITRAIKCGVLICHPDAFTLALTTSMNNRQTFLKSLRELL